MEDRRGAKRERQHSRAEVQSGNRSWWTGRPMAYDWRNEIRADFATADWFDAVDARFLEAARLYATDREPFDRIIPFADLDGRDVLEIGCGMGMHTELMARHGARVTAVDLTPTAVRATIRRLELRGIEATVRQMDAEHLDFADHSFDFVWSWGVIHHSARTARIVREIARVLRPEGSCRVMVYSRQSLLAAAYFVRHLLTGAFLHRSFEETLYRSTDGFSARFVIPEHFEDVFAAFFEQVSSTRCGQVVDAIPFPRALRDPMARVVPERVQRAIVERWGSLLLVTARLPG